MTNSESAIRNLNIWFEQALKWLHADGSAEPLQRPHRQLLEKMEDARRDNQPNLVWEYITELEELTLQTSGTLEHGEIFIRCAKVAGNLGNLKDALRLCQAAESRYKSYRHPHAVSLWMSGCIYWATHQRVKAITNWQAAISRFNDLKENIQIEHTKKEWYEKIAQKLERCLEWAIDKDDLPPYEEEDAASPDPAEASPPGPNQPLDTLKWTFVPVIDSVSASGFGPVGFETSPRGYLEVSEVMIANEPYKVYSVRRKSLWKNTVNIKHMEKFETVLVTGPSMNDAKPVPIEDGDYIFVRHDETPQNNDIVIARVSDMDELATVKRLRKTGDKLQLLAESLDPQFQNHPDAAKEFEKGQIKVAGVVEAVFKKKAL